MAKVENSPTFLPEYPLTRLVPGSRAVYKFDKKEYVFLHEGVPKMPRSRTNRTAMKLRSDGFLEKTMMRDNEKTTGRGR